MSTDDDLADDDSRAEVLLVRVWRSAGGLRARVLWSGSRNGWVPTSIGTTADVAHLRRLVDAWIDEISGD